jgi:Sec-independent protein secretion pathway component TatC
MARFHLISRTLAALAVVFLVGAMIGRLVAFELVRVVVAGFESAAINGLFEPGATANFVSRVGIGTGFLFQVPFLCFLLARRQARIAQIPHLSRCYAVFIFVLAAALFFAGAMFAWFVVLQFTLKFLTELSSPDIVISLSVSSFADFVTKMMIVAALAFETPLVIFLLAGCGSSRPALSSVPAATRLWPSPSWPPSSPPRPTHLP